MAPMSEVQALCREVAIGSRSALSSLADEQTWNGSGLATDLGSGVWQRLERAEQLAAEGLELLISCIVLDVGEYCRC
jgi:hypothetical protein